MINVLIIGDAHIPKRGTQIPPLMVNELKNFVSSNLFDYVIYTGDVVKSPDTINFLRDLANKKFIIVQGNMDYYYGNLEAPLTDELKLKLSDNAILKMAITHGAEVYPRGDINELLKIANEENAHILISGHTHSAQIHLANSGVLLLNPGSCTGAWSFVASGIPSYIIMKVDNENDKIAIELHELKNNTISIENKNFLFENTKLISFNLINCLFSFT